MEFLIGLIILVLVIWALINVWQSSESTGAKVLWSLGLIFFNVIGLIIWFFFGPKSGTRVA
jgi:L-cystine uptake protein TcyP (sodium:dicarboxylate symporter family)